jgi:hypothetical protein
MSQYFPFFTLIALPSLFLPLLFIHCAAPSFAVSLYFLLPLSFPSIFFPLLKLVSLFLLLQSLLAGEIR